MIRLGNKGLKSLVFLKIIHSSYPPIYALRHNLRHHPLPQQEWVRAGKRTKVVGGRRCERMGTGKNQYGMYYCRPDDEAPFGLISRKSEIFILKETELQSYG